MSEASGAEALAGQEASPAEAPATGNAEAPWFGNQEFQGYVENKGWKEAGDVVQGYQNLEKILGDKANAMLRPKEGDEQGWNDFYNAMGRPANAEGYNLAEVEGSDNTVSDWFRGAAHKNGLSQGQAEAIYNEWNDFVAAQNGEMTEKSAAESETQMRELRREWGQQYDANINAGKRAASRFGFDAETLNQMESVMGTKALLSKFAEIGKSLGEDTFEGGGNTGFGMSPAAAQSQINELKMDPNFTKQYLDPQAPGHREAVAKMTRLQQAAAAGSA